MEGEGRAELGFWADFWWWEYGYYCCAGFGEGCCLLSLYGKLVGIFGMEKINLVTRDENHEMVR